MMYEGRSLIVMDRSYTHRIPFESILYIKQELRNVEIVTCNEIVRMYGRVLDLENKLSEDFIRCHSYCIVNAKMIYKIGDGKINFYGGKSIALGHKSFVYLKKRFNELVSKYQ